MGNAKQCFLLLRAVYAKYQYYASVVYNVQRISSTNNSIE